MVDPIDGQAVITRGLSGQLNKKRKSLFDEMRSEQNLFAAWRHVKKSALRSSNNSIKGDAATFEHLHQRHLKRIGRQLYSGKFTFDKVTGVLKDKKARVAQGKDPRPIAVSSIKNRVVQRAILQVLQPRRIRDERDVNTRFISIEDKRLGTINQVNKSRYGVGGLLKPYGGVKPAIQMILGAMNDGAVYYYQSDIKAFFTKIPLKNVVDILDRETKDSELIQLFEAGLKIELENKDELLTYANLFPSNGIGVAQGSSLSAFAGNVLLYDLDHELNAGPVVAVRYIDDVVMVSADKSSLDNAIELAEKRLKDFGFKLYNPSVGSEKASYGKCVDSVNFLGCSVQPNRCVPSSKAVQNLKREVSELISKSQLAITTTLKTNTHLHKSNSQSAVVDLVGKKMFGWQQSFSFCTDDAPLKSLDKEISKKIVQYTRFVHRVSKNESSEVQAKILGIPILEELFQLNLNKSDKSETV